MAGDFDPHLAQQQMDKHAKEADQKEQQKAFERENKHLKETKTNKNSDHTDVLLDAVIVNVFFDGTRNNYYNTDARKGGGYVPVQNKDSYENDYTNVAWLFRSAIDSPCVNVYIEGMGTSQGKEDDQQGYALGSGPTGITDRAASAFGEIKNKVEKAGKKPTYLLLNVFGFSRGSATARHFIHLAKTQPESFSNWGLSRSSVQVNFVGLYDTVASFSPDTQTAAKQKVMGSLFENNTSDLHLNFNDDYANKVFHLVAKDEFRENFSLTTIASAGNKGFEMRIPGAHSDIGGSYTDKASERIEIDADRNMPVHDFLIQGGWYTKEDFNPSVIPNPRENDLAKITYIGTRTISNIYYKVGLNVMHTMIQNYVKALKFNPNLPLNDSGAIGYLVAHFVKEAKNNDGVRQLHQADLPYTDDRKTSIYRNFLHFSSNFETSRISKTPLLVTPFMPNLVGGIPQRIIRGG